MSARPEPRRLRSPLLPWAVLCLAGFVLLAVPVAASWQPLADLDSAVGRGPQGWTQRHQAAVGFWEAVQAVFSTLPMAVVTVLLAAALHVRAQRRAAYWTVAVMLGASVSTYLLKLLLARERPVWPNPIETLQSFSFPSGHASGIAALMGVATVLTLMLVRRVGLRRGLVAVWMLLVLVVGADRVFLGVHNLSDVVAGWLLGGFWALGAAVVYHPAPRPTAEGAPSLPEVYPSARRLAVVLNPAKVTDAGGFRAVVEEMAAVSGWSHPTWHLTTVEDPGRAMAEEAAIDGADLVIVCGGDGTVRAVCAELAGTGIPVGIVPAGTGNLLARNLGIPLYRRSAVDVALNGQDRAIDMVTVGGDGIDTGQPHDEVFLVMAGMGFDAAIMEGVNEQVKARVGWIAYVLSALRSLMFPAVRLEVSVDGADFTRHRARTVVIGNVGTLQAGMPLLPDAAIDDGRIDVVLLHPRRFLSWIPLAVRVVSKQKRTDETIERMTGKTVEVRASHETPRQLDGDPIGKGTHLWAECVPGRLLVRVPR